MVIKLRSAVGVAMVWVAIVAGVSVTAWFAIDRAGRDITGGGVDALPPPTLGSALGTPTPEGGPSPTEPTKASATPEPSATTAPSPSTAPSVSPAPSSPPAPATISRDRTFSLDGGQVSVRCTGITIRLRIAQPDDGFRVDVERAGPEEVHVIFRRGDEEDEGGAQVTAVCVAGTPALKVEDRT